jgi:hypothetical protein
MPFAPAEHLEHHRVVGVIAVDTRQVLKAGLVSSVAASPHHAFSNETV